MILASGEFKDMASVLEKHMQGRQFVAGDSVTVADFVMAYTLDWGNEAKLLDGCPVWKGMSKSEQNKYLDECFAYDDELRKNGHWIAFGALDP